MKHINLLVSVAVGLFELVDNSEGLHGTFQDSLLFQDGWYVHNTWDEIDEEEDASYDSDASYQGMLTGGQDIRCMEIRSWNSPSLIQSLQVYVHPLSSAAHHLEILTS